MGESGAGKSTILNLIFRLYDPYEGAISIDGIDIKKLKFDFRK
jgi:ATP-binding cassette subfamily B protein